ncbi:30S ribosomal protein S10 [Candidatus Similichlamydia laticola]|uniref:Small ribosomal subunit protein uS10 n=1 Tax=Candidatus Similichlamydia laticola TaxID=2170265 RepID=A0A369KFP5_9BACT|nr:30S ribosomal protein S10 [Candidatus Similichlamydia laticola]RDB31727.1 SSU ribosomal protein S10p (S20e) [Candidatus Similichlamydia laticola]
MPKKKFEKKIRIRLKGFDKGLLDHSARDITETAKRTGAMVVGPIPLPTSRERYTVLRSPHVDRKSREQFELITYNRLIEILDPPAKTLDALKGLALSCGVDIKLKI